MGDRAAAVAQFMDVTGASKYAALPADGACAIQEFMDITGGAHLSRTL